MNIFVRFTFTHFGQMCPHFTWQRRLHGIHHHSDMADVFPRVVAMTTLQTQDTLFTSIHTCTVLTRSWQFHTWKIKIYSHRFLLLVDTSASLGSAPPRLFSSFLFLFFSVRNGSNLLPSCAANWSVCVKRPGEGCEGALFNEVWSH